MEFVGATAIATDLGSSRYTNIVMLGALSASDEFPIDRDLLLETVLENVPPHTIEGNQKAFEMGEKAFLDAK